MTANRNSNESEESDMLHMSRDLTQLAFILSGSFSSSSFS